MAIRWYTERLSAAVDQGQAHYDEAQRWLAKEDLFYLLVALLRRGDANRDWIFDRCREVQAAPNGHLDLWAREHYKSTIITFALTIQDILADPETTVGIFSHTRPIAKGFLRQIKQEFEGNGKLKALFPDVLWTDPKRQAPKWSEDDGIVVRRTGNPKESTIEAWGLVDGQPTGKHFNRLIYDDLVTKESITSPDMIKKVTSSWELSLALGVENGVRRYIGTRSHFADSYGEMIRRGAAVARVHPATSDGKVDGPPVLMQAETLREKRRDMGPYTFGCQMLLDPKADETQGFREEWLEYWPAAKFNDLNLYILVDPASDKKKHSDYTSMFVVGFGEDHCYRVVAMLRDRLSLTQRADALFAFHRDYRPQAVGYEQYGMQADIEHIKDRQKRENYKFKIVPLGGQLAKVDRIRRLIPLFEQGNILLPDHHMRVTAEGVNEDLTRIFIDEEYLAFPVSVHDDMLDALSRICDPDFVIVAPRVRTRQSNAGRANNAYRPQRWRG